MLGMRISIVIAALAFTVVGVCWARFTLFVVQPGSAILDGSTLIIPRAPNLNFIDSADAICARTIGVSPACRAVVLGRIETETIYAHLPYSERLYRLSIGDGTER